MPSAPLSHRHVLTIALPIIFSNMTTPLIGFVDTTIIGQLGLPHLIGAVAVGAMIFNIVFLGFNFLRMGTTGLTAQAVGAGDLAEVSAMLTRALTIALVFGLALLVLQRPILSAAFWLVEPSVAVATAARDYYNMRIWAAPAALINFALIGWFIGLGRVSLAFWVQLFLNCVNIVLAILFVQGFSWGVKGVGLAALLAEFSAAVVGIGMAWREMRRRGGYIAIAGIMDIGKLRRMMSVNGDIMLRSLALLTVFTFFTAQSVRAGDLTLAANAVLKQWLDLSAYMLDGFAFATEALVGQALGAQKKSRFLRAAKLSTGHAALLSLLITAGLIFAGPWLIDFMTVSPEVRTAARNYYLWAAFAPFIGVWCFQLDGIYIGATWTRDMRNMMLLSLVIYIAAWAVLMPLFGNHGLWASLMVFYIVRAITLRWQMSRLVTQTFSK